MLLLQLSIESCWTLEREECPAGPVLQLSLLLARGIVNVETLASTDGCKMQLCKWDRCKHLLAVKPACCNASGSMSAHSVHRSGQYACCGQGHGLRSWAPVSISCIAVRALRTVSLTIKVQKYSTQQCVLIECLPLVMKPQSKCRRSWPGRNCCDS